MMDLLIALWGFITIPVRFVLSEGYPQASDE